jgi:N-acetylmuramoyl-L-alanine amidase
MHFEDRQLAMDRRDFLRLGGAGLAGAVLLGTAGRSLAQTGSLRMEFESAAQKYGVPVELLLAMGYVNTLWEMPPPSDYEQGDIESRGTYGIMHLEQNPFRDTLGRAASLTGLSEEQLKSDRASNIEGGAALLSELVGETRPDNLDGWQEAVAAYADTDLYTNDVYGVLKSGASLTISTGESVELSPQAVTVPQVYAAQGGFGYPSAEWRPADRSNYTNSNREASYNITKVVIHVAQGSYSDTIRWFKNPKADASAHYVVSRRGRIAQCVRNEDIAWHAGWWRTNTQSIGIEHAGYVSNPNSFTRRMYRASARLTAWCCKRHHIPIDRHHIIGHYQVPGCPGAGGGVSCHTDPGRYWNWNKYMRFVKYYRKRL